MLVSVHYTTDIDKRIGGREDLQAAPTDLTRLTHLQVSRLTVQRYYTYMYIYLLGN